jgi:5-(carboxyamino)imidazole ribonucleotide synthase
MSLAPGSTIGILGGGQLGRMLAVAAARLGYKCHVYAPDEALPPAAEVSALFTRGDYADEAALSRFGASVDVATYEFENIAAGPLRALTAQTQLYPPVLSLKISQDRGVEKGLVDGSLGGRTAPNFGVNTRRQLDGALARAKFPAILKTARFGYDGKGQVRINSPEEADAAWEALGGTHCILEAFVDFAAEFSILLCRSTSGEVLFWDAPRNCHENGILKRCVVPAGEDLAAHVAEAQELSARIAHALGHVGVLAVEFFAADDGPVFNEMAPRVTIAATGPSKARSPPNSRTMCARSAGCLWAPRR